MDTSFTLSILTPDKSLFEGEVSYLSVPGGQGYFGVLANHAPLVSSLVQGQFEFRPTGGKAVLFKTTGRGFCEISAKKASLLLDAADSNAISPIPNPS